MFLFCLMLIYKMKLKMLFILGLPGSSGVTETLGAPRNLVRWGLCREFILVEGP